MDIPLVNLSFQWQEKVFHLKLKTTETVVDLKKLIYIETDLEPNRQKFVNFDLPESIKDEEYEMGNLKIEPDFILVVEDKIKMFSPSQQIGDHLGKDIPPDEGTAILESSGEVQPSGSKSGAGDEQPMELSAPRFFNFYIFNEPQDNKKLAVLDIDKTIYDISAGTKFFPETRNLLAERPFLQEFLQAIYEDYNIAVWSSTELESILRKLNVLNMLDNPHYKIWFCLDKNAIRRVRLGPCRLYSKPLEVIWVKYSQFNCKNTVIIDDRLSNFNDNPRNGIHVTRYVYRNYSSDKELLHLMPYLKLIAKSDDVTAFDHRKWKELCKTPDTESRVEDTKSCELGESSKVPESD